MITEAHKRNYEQYVKPYLSNLWPESLEAVKEIIKRNLTCITPKYDYETLKRMSLGLIMQFAKPIPPKRDKIKRDPLIINEHPRITLSDIYIGLWYDDLVKEIQAEQAIHPMAAQFLN